MKQNYRVRLHKSKKRHIGSIKEVALCRVFQPILLVNTPFNVNTLTLMDQGKQATHRLLFLLCIVINLIIMLSRTIEMRVRERERWIVLDKGKEIGLKVDTLNMKMTIHTPLRCIPLTW